MAFEIPGQMLGVLEAAADLSEKQFYCVKIDSNGAIALAGAGEAAVGVLQNKPVAAEAAEVMVMGTTKAVAGAAISKGALVASDANGKLKAAVLGKTDTSDAGAAADPLIGSHVLGVALEAATADLQVISIQLLHLGAVPTTAA